MLGSRGAFDGVRMSKVTLEKAASGGKENVMSPLSSATGARYFCCCRFPALGRKEDKTLERRAPKPVLLLL